MFHHKPKTQNPQFYTDGRKKSWTTPPSPRTTALLRMVMTPRPPTWTVKSRMTTSIPATTRTLTCSPHLQGDGCGREGKSLHADSTEGRLMLREVPRAQTYACRSRNCEMFRPEPGRGTVVLRCHHEGSWQKRCVGFSARVCGLWKRSWISTTIWRASLCEGFRGCLIYIV